MKRDLSLHPFLTLKRLTFLRARQDQTSHDKAGRNSPISCADDGRDCNRPLYHSGGSHADSSAPQPQSFPPDLSCHGTPDTLPLELVVFARHHRDNQHMSHPYRHEIDPAPRLLFCRLPHIPQLLRYQPQGWSMQWQARTYAEYFFHCFSNQKYLTGTLYPVPLLEISGSYFIAWPRVYLSYTRRYSTCPETVQRP